MICRQNAERPQTAASAGAESQSACRGFESVAGIAKPLLSRRFPQERSLVSGMMEQNVALARGVLQVREAVVEQNPGLLPDPDRSAEQEDRVLKLSFAAVWTASKSSSRSKARESCR